MAEPARPGGFTPADLRARIERVEVARRQVRLPSDALVMRGGTLQRTDLERALTQSRHDLKRPGLSVWAADVPTTKDLFNLKPLPHAQVSFTTVGRLEKAGFELEQTFDPPHYTAWLPPDDAEDDGFWLQMFCRAFDDPVPRETLTT